MTRPTAPWPAVVLASTALLALLLAVDAPPSVRLPVALWFFLVCPGMAWLPARSLRPAPAVLAVGVGLSLAIDVIAALVLIASGAGISPWSTFAILAAVCVAGCAGQWFLAPAPLSRAS